MILPLVALISGAEVVLADEVLNSSREESQYHFVCYGCKHLVFWTLAQLEEVLGCGKCGMEHQINPETMRPYWFKCVDCHRPFPIIKPMELRTIICPFPHSENMPKARLYSLISVNPHPKISYRTASKMNILPVM